MDIFFSIFSLVLGLLIGSFLNCLVWRLKEGESLGGRSHCRACKRLVRWHDNIPVLSFCYLRGKCRDCRETISWQYPIIEALTGALFFFAAWRIAARTGLWIEWDAQNWLMLVRDWIFLSALVAIFIMDLRWYVILDEITLPAAGALLVLNLLIGMSWQGLALSATIGTGFFLIQYAVSRGRWIGGGDIRLGLLLGAALGWPGILLAIFLGYFGGAIVGSGLLAAGKKGWGSQLPLGTFLTVSAAVTLFWGEAILDWYLHLINFR